MNIKDIRSLNHLANKCSHIGVFRFVKGSNRTHRKTVLGPFTHVLFM